MREYLKRLREKQKITQEQLANQIGINANYYCMIENGDRQKNMELLMANKIATTLSVPVEFIITEESKLTERASA